MKTLLSNNIFLQTSLESESKTIINFKKQFLYSADDIFNNLDIFQFLSIKIFF